MQLDYMRRGVAEFIGTFALIFVGAGSALYGNIVGSAFANGLVIAIMVSSFAGISGGHFNPAVTFGFFVTRRIAPAMAAFYWVVQLAGAALAGLALKWIFGTIAGVSGQETVGGLHLGAPSLQGGISSGQGVMIEAILTFFLVLVVFATAVDVLGAFDKIAGLAIGLTITFGVLMGGGLTGAALNPARAFGPELAADYWTNAWVWYVGPLAGGALAAVLYEVLYLGRPAETDEEPPAGEGIDPLAPAPATDAPA
ncbi:MAG TPA: aquaporin [Gaiellaceae bacterium]|nr:aquaporin [Gaiellaceae bacterium]